MKYYKFSKIKGGEDPIIRVTYKTWWGKLISKDICKCPTVETYWIFMESGQLTHNFGPINNFHNNNNYDVYWVNDIIHEIDILN